MGKEFDYVYHSSSRQNLKAIKPDKSTHDEKWIYATTSIEMSAVFLSGKGGDLTCQVGRDKVTGKVFICERFKNSFDFRYNNYSGSIYKLSSHKFINDKTGWGEEVVSNEVVEIVEEIKINDVKKYILKLIKQGKVLLIKYPQKIGNIPNDDEDLVYRGIIWTRQFGEEVLNDFKKLHPVLMIRIEEGLKSGKYLDENVKE